MNPDEFPELVDIDEEGHFFFADVRIVHDFLAGYSDLLENDDE